MGISVESGAGAHDPYAASYSSSKDKGVRPAVRARSAAKSLLLGACAVGGLFGLLAVTGFLSPRNGGGSSAQSAAYTKSGIMAGPRRSLRGRAAVVLASGGKRIERGKVDHHHARVLLVPSLEPFTRRNVHHYREHDAKGRLVPPGGHRNDSDRHVHVEWAEVRWFGLLFWGFSWGVGLQWVGGCLSLGLGSGLDTCNLPTEGERPIYRDRASLSAPFLPFSPTHAPHPSSHPPSVRALDRTSWRSGASTCGTPPTSSSSATTTSSLATPGACVRRGGRGVRTTAACVSIDR
jgi:uncharacterized membrane protein YedE/YeeE